MNNQQAIKQYTHIDNQSLINEASPHQLIAMLINGALARLTTAKGCLEHTDLAGKGEQLSKAIDIIAGLQSSLDMESGGEISANLDALYDYMTRRLLAANAQNDTQAITEVMDLLSEVKKGWDAIPAEFHHLSAAAPQGNNQAKPAKAPAA